MSALSPKNENFLNTESLLPLFQYMTTIPVIQNILLKNKYDKSNLKWEIKVLSNLISKHCEEKDLQKLTALYKYLTEKYPDVASCLALLLRLAITCGYTSARVSVFSLHSLTYIDSSQRISSSPFRECALTHLFFEQNIVRDITFEEFAKEWVKKPRKMYFFILVC